jgi:hypothetical protein
MALPTVTGTLDTDSGWVYPNNAGTWSGLSGTTWASWLSWNNQVADPMIWLTDAIEVSFTEPYNLRISSDAVGTVSYDVYTSNTGVFGGEESVVTIANGATSVASFTSKFIRVAVKVSGDENILKYVEVKATNFALDLVLSNINTSTLPGTVGNRTLPMPRTVGGIISITATAQPTSSYTPNVYVTDQSTSTTVYAIVNDKNKDEPKIGLYGIDGYARDSVVDIHIRALPLQKMVGNNLVSQ